MLTKSEFEKALHIHDEKEKHFSQRESALKRRESEQREKEKKSAQQFKNKLRQLTQDNEKKLKNDRQTARKEERTRAERQQAGLKEKVKQLTERLRQRERGTTPQSEGLEFEEKLVSRLKKEFPEDEILHKGKGGDVLHLVKFNRKHTGTIIYECKRTPSIQKQHILQTNRAKQTREADFAVLVTTGKKRGFSGFRQIDGVSVVSPLAVISLASLLRQQLIEMARLKITKEKRAILAQKLMQYVDSPQFKNPLEEVVQRTSKLQDMIKKEYSDHMHTWRERWNHYYKISWNTTHIRDNLRLALHGEQPKHLSQHKAPPLQLAATK
ncbi:MAG: DUF2130 domain-containing protein [Nitrososphaerales archaeon]